MSMSKRPSPELTVPDDVFLGEFAQKRFIQDAFRVYDGVIALLGRDMSLSQNISFAEKLGALKTTFQEVLQGIAFKKIDNNEKIIEARDLFLDNDDVKNSLTKEEYDEFIWIFSEVMREIQVRIDTKEVSPVETLFEKEKTADERTFELYKKISLEVFAEMEREVPEMIPEAFHAYVAQEAGKTLDMSSILAWNGIKDQAENQLPPVPRAIIYVKSCLGILDNAKLNNVRFGNDAFNVELFRRILEKLENLK